MWLVIGLLLALNLQMILLTMHVSHVNTNLRQLDRNQIGRANNVVKTIKDALPERRRA